MLIKKSKIYNIFFVLLSKEKNEIKKSKQIIIY